MKKAWSAIVRHHKKIITAAIAVAVIAILSVILIFSLRPKPAPTLTYQPVRACDLFTTAEAHTLLGKNVIGNVADPVVSGDTAVSKCSFSSLMSDQNAIMVAAVAVRSAVTDAGVTKNSADFDTDAKEAGNEPVADLGDKAYFNPSLGQLNFISRHQWIIISYGQGTAPETNTLEKDTELAHIVLGHLEQKK